MIFEFSVMIPIPHTFWGVGDLGVVGEFCRVRRSDLPSIHSCKLCADTKRKRFF